MEFYSIESPLAQPRNAILGQIISALVGVAICKLFKLSDSFEEHRWAGGALACALATSIMALTKTVHPPAGATALLAVIDDGVVHLGWFLVPVMMLGCGLMLVVALLVNNIERRFPIYWWTPESLTKERHDSKEPKKSIEDSEAGNQEAQSEQEPSHDLSALERQTTLHGETEVIRTEEMEIVIRRGGVMIPDGMQIRQEEMQWLMGLADRL